MISRRNFLIKSITSLVYLAISGCAKAGELSSRQNEDSGFKLSDSPNFNKLTKRFQHPAGDLNEKSFGDLFNFLWGASGKMKWEVLVERIEEKRKHLHGN